MVPPQQTQPPGSRPATGAREGRVPLVVTVVVVLAAGAVALALALGPDGSTSGPSAGRTPAGTAVDGASPSAGRTSAAPALPPAELGQDPVLDALARQCHAGDMQACDDLYDAADAGSDYETYGDTCAGRQPSGTFTMCVDAFSRG